MWYLENETHWEGDSWTEHMMIKRLGEDVWTKYSYIPVALVTTFLSLWQNSLTMSASKKKAFNWVLTVPYGPEELTLGN